MAVFKCKMCGAPLDVRNESVLTCSYCATTQTLPRLTDERRAAMYDRANHFRRNGEYDKAMGVYEQILFEDNTDAESYWSLVLCRYGIEYVKDPATGRRVPTVNRAQYTSVYDDINYKQAINNADMSQKVIYESEAAAINEIQKVILEISSREEPFDVFICYKETDNMGRRTLDSVLATDIYDKLTKEGLKVFFSRITLEDKLGSAYEPYIFAALNSSKVMIVLGTSAENFSAVWVKNEWSRYLGLIKNGEDKTLIPAYRDMSPYDLPDEFSHLQAQDMGKIGFMQDIVHGVTKIVFTDERQKSVNVTEKATIETFITGVQPLLDRAYIFLEDKKWEDANRYCEKVLDIDPKNSRAYLGKLLCDMRKSIPEDLRDCEGVFYLNDNYKKIERFGDEQLKKTLIGYLNHIEERNELARKEGIYNNALRMLNAKTPDISALKKAANDFLSIGDYKDSKEKSERCIDLVTSISLNEKYKTAVGLMGADTTSISKLTKAEEIFENIKGFKDADKRLLECQKRKEELKRKAERRKKAAIIIGSVIAAVFCLCVSFAIINVTVVPMVKYNGAIKIAEEKDFENLNSYEDYNEYVKAAMVLGSLKNYKDAKQISFYMWDNIIANETFSAGSCHTVAVKNDGTVMAMGDNENGQCGEYFSDWEDVVSVSAGYDRTVVLKSDGTVDYCGDSGDELYDVFDWEDIVAVSTGKNHIAGLKKDGTVVIAGENKNNEFDVSRWKNIVSVSAGRNHIIGLKSDGTVEAVGSSISGQRDVYRWREIIAVSAGDYHTVGLKKDGTVVAVGDNTKGQCDVSDWTDIIAVSAGEYHTVGLKKDGTVVAVGMNDDGQCSVSDWKDIIAVSAGGYHSLGLKSDGTLVAVGRGDKGQCDASVWEDIVAVSAGGDFTSAYTVGIRNDGTVAIAGGYLPDQDKLRDWADIIAVSAGDGHIAGLKNDGTVVASGFTYDGQCDVSDWTDIIAVSAGDNHTVGLKRDGTVVAVGDNEDGQCDVSAWEDIIAVSAGGTSINAYTVGLKKDGTVVCTDCRGYYCDGQCKVSDWTDIIAVSTGDSHTVGLRSDGTVVAVGDNGEGQCKVSGWTDIVAVSAGDDYTVGLRSDGTVVLAGADYDVSDWKDIVAVSASDYHMVGLKSDGTLISKGSNENGERNIHLFSDIKIPD